MMTAAEEPVQNAPEPVDLLDTTDAPKEDGAAGGGDATKKTTDPAKKKKKKKKKKTEGTDGDGKKKKEGDNNNGDGKKKKDGDGKEEGDNDGDDDDKKKKKKKPEEYAIGSYPQMQEPENGAEKKEKEIIDPNNNNGVPRGQVPRIIGAVICVIVLIVVLVVTLTGRGGDDDENPDDGYRVDWTDAPTQNTVTDVNLLPVPEDLDETCSTANIATTSGKQACELACAEADCCDNPYTLSDISCLWGNEDICHEYHVYCVILEQGHSQASNSILVPAAPSNLENVCSTAELATPRGLENCHTACSQAICCWEDDFTVISQTCAFLPECADYAICHNVKAASHHNPTAITAALEEQCDDYRVRASNGGYAACEAACEQAACCFDDDDVTCIGEDPSQGGTSNFCEQYEPCFIVMNDLMPPPTDLDELCNYEQISSNQYQKAECADECSVSDCCASKNACLDNNQDLCFDYHKYCIALDDNYDVEPSTYNVPTAPSDIDTMCSFDSITMSGTLQACEDRCNQAACCYEDIDNIGSGKTCALNDNCIDYAICLNLKSPMS